MSLTCDQCGAAVLEVDVKCAACGQPLSATTAFRMVGNVVLGQYEIIDVLGQGGMSVVYKGRHRLTGQEVALKILPPEMAALAQVKSRFVEEAKALAQLDHPNIVHLYNFGEENGSFVLAMQFVQGQTFERMILDAGSLPWPEASCIAIDVLRALEYAHSRGVIHRDMKPSNILVREDDGSATVMDFGIAKITTSTRLTATGQTMGTVRYMSPEQVRGMEMDARTDIYSLGATLYEAVCGDTPFDGDTHFAIMTKHLTEPAPAPSDSGVVVPPAFDAILLRTLAKDPDDRFASAREFRKELEQLLREHDPNWTDTLRGTRVGMAVSDPAIRLPTAPDRPSALGMGGAGKSLSGRALTREERQELGAASTDSLSTLEETAAPDPKVLAGRRSAATEPPEPATEPGPRSGLLWLGVAVSAALAAAAVGFYLVQRPPASRSDAQVPETPVTVGIEAERWPAAFVPPGVTVSVDETLADAEVRVLAPEGWDPAKLFAARDAGHALFSDMLVERKLARAVDRPPLSIVIVPRRVFCDPRTYETGAVAQDCRDKEILYRPKERTLLVVDDPEYMDVNIAYGNALAVCLHSEIAGCDDAIADIDSEFARRKKTRAPGK